MTTKPTVSGRAGKRKLKRLTMWAVFHADDDVQPRLWWTRRAAMHTTPSGGYCARVRVTEISKRKAKR